ncbi:DUF4142 domain-containing protein [Pontibacter cellulosilyticus]|uniref:DUF4142 domain-containing protein n=1 Tax=Pontibacter cellulosilyticus TaxID=1720253 RepID=A0A923SK99_9BACT|nr:DUF4142 domain-containing protein [Pontibacter cellulosilyticus]MBC5993566.1 DUF4142 domain-containing protein [Pontibacter cellulosilyticus]
MKKYLIAAVCLFLSLSFSACDSGNKEEVGGNTAEVASDSMLTEEHQEHMMTVARYIMLQKELARLALEKSETQNAKAYGQDLMNWANTKQSELQEMAQTYGVTLPQQMEDSQTKHIDDIAEVEAKNYKYDEELWDTIKDAQRDAVEDFDKALNDVDEASGTAYTLWLRNTTKELRAHLEQAAAYDLELKNREGGISEQIVEDINN